MTSQKYPSITWETGLRHEALRVLYYLNRLPDQQLQRRGFLVLPKLPKTNRSISIVIPDLNYSSIKNLWSQISHLSSTTPMTAPEALITQVSSLLTPTYIAPQTEFISIPPKFFQTLFMLLPEYQNIISQINLIVTHSGTSSQFNVVNSHKSILTIYLRPDSTLADICRIIILALIREPLSNREHRAWEEIMTIADFISSHTLLKDIYPTSEALSTMSNLQQQQTGPLYQKSLEYQSHLGIPIKNNWLVENNQIFYQSIPITQLTSRQFELLKLLVNSYGQTVKLDQIADTLWPSGEDYSLWAIVKEIARIRQRIVRLGLPGSLIKSHRKIGYSIN